MAILRGNLAPEGSVVKHSAVPEEMFKAVLKAKPLTVRRTPLRQLSRKIQPGDAVFIRMKDLRDRNAGNVLYHRSHLL